MANLSAIKLPNGTTYNLVDKTSGYTKNTGTITSIKTTAGAHTTIDVSSGAATFNVPTKTSHLTNDSNFITLDNIGVSNGLIGITYNGIKTISSTNFNLVNGSQTGSLRTIGSTAEDSSYTIGLHAFAEGRGTAASGSYSHAEGYDATASGNSSHAEGSSTTASGMYSHAQNGYTIAARANQTAIGKYNIEDKETAEANQKALIIGNGTSSARSNALTVDWSGNVDIASGATYKINGVALSASDVGAQPTLVSGTNIKTINNQSILGSGNIPAASIPTADTIAEFDSAAHMSSTDMTTQEVSDFVSSLNVGGGDEIINLFYPVGSYYETEDATFNPNVTWGGTWTLESTAKQPTGEYARFGTRWTSNFTTTSRATICSVPFTSKTGRVYIHANAAFYTSRYTSAIAVALDGTILGDSGTNSTTLQRGIVEMIADVGTEERTYSMLLSSQDTGTTATMPAYQHFTLFVMDVANPNGGVYKWRRTA